MNASSNAAGGAPLYKEEINDLPMILGYNGYTVATARPAIQEQARKVYDSVGAMLENNL